ncbi:YchJ family metal-binding protein [Glaciimonas sp. CA11.2]|uniref:YchJ family protein n=1 Tax=unclassified Glaciimonas TaxID=2644401 RepID=UPI002AB46887|nr:MULTISPECIES: YchJ family metal-binding protein [unclassified Glaciimonas]MDY7545968.1 YchJ family metal-binding protein [Glaciimonas sp. CA11.2]MEB0012188.1 YchJ family metal-binding protein [Glaciimonas sp. Cout2]MEB0082371.1 YchJ family metal-binding protein [Glaciimonas sp. Gout2]MEB0161329.1 YchJ family metal-binding protein [Glaciimonas sp. CA11.2]
MNKSHNAALCPCGGGQFSTCCGRFLAPQVGLYPSVPQTAQELMRSRYTAYTLRDDVYLSATWHRSTRPAAENIVSADDGLKWLGLEIRQHETDGNHATVEFVARYKVGGRAQRLHEVSQFVRELAETETKAQLNESAYRWFYVDGYFPEKII